MRQGDFEIAVVPKGSQEPLPEVVSQDGKHYVVAAPGQPFELGFMAHAMPANTSALLVGCIPAFAFSTKLCPWPKPMLG
jgi:hypothetical protein